MLKKILGIFSRPKKVTERSLPPKLNLNKLGQPASEEASIAITVILVHIASSDEEVAKEEAETICSLLAVNLDLADNKIPSIVEKAIISRREKGNLDDFIALVNNTYSIEQRLRILAMAWKLVLSDNKVEKPEERLLVKIAASLYLGLEQQEQAKNMAEDGTV